MSLRQGLRSFSASRRRTVSPDRGQQRQGPAFAAGGRLGACRRHQQGLFLACQLAFRARTRLLTQGPLQIAFHEAALGPADGGKADPDGSDNLCVATAGIGRQQNLRPLQLAGGMLAAAEHYPQLVPLGLAQFDPITYIHASPPCRRLRTNPAMSQKSGGRLTEKQGHYLAFIHTYSYMFGQPPAEADIQRHFRVSPPSVHQMIVTLERNGFIRRRPGVARSIEILLPAESLPILEWLGIKTSKPL
jgi:repressor LexA